MSNARDEGIRRAQRMTDQEHRAFAAQITAVLEEIRRSRESFPRAASTPRVTEEPGRLNLPPDTEKIARGRW